MMATNFVDHEAEESGAEDVLFDEEDEVQTENADMDGFIDDMDDTVDNEDPEDLHTMMDVENAMIIAEKDREEAERMQQHFSSQMSQVSANASSSPVPMPVAPVIRPSAPKRPAPKEVTASYKPIGPQVSNQQAFSHLAPFNFFGF